MALETQAVNVEVKVDQDLLAKQIREVIRNEIRHVAASLRGAALSLDPEGEMQHEKWIREDERAKVLGELEAQNG